MSSRTIRVFLSVADDSVRSERECIVRELLGRGFEVVGDGPYDASSPTAEDALRSDLRSSCLSIHLIGRSISDDALALNQLRAANEHSAEVDDYPVLIWQPRDLPVDAAASRIIASAYERIGSGAHVEVLRCGIEDFKTYITDRLSSRTDASSETMRLHDGARVYLMYDRRDVDAAQAVEAYAQQCGVEVIEPSFDSDQVALRHHHQRSLRTCDAAMIVYGRVGEQWVRMKQQDLMKAAGFGRERPMIATAIFLAPEPTANKDQFRAQNISLIRSVEGLSEEAFVPFFEQVQAGMQ